MSAKTYPVPKFHTILNLPSNDHTYSVVRAVFTDCGPLQSQIEYFISPSVRSKAKSWRHACARSIGLLYDFVCVVGHSYSGREDQILTDFVRCLCTGTVFEEKDITGLWWPKSSWQTVKDTANYVKGFSDWCIKKYGTKTISSTHELNWGERFARYRALDKRNDNSLLGHLSGAELLWQEAGTNQAFDFVNEIGNIKIVEEFGKAFPNSGFEELLFTGYQNRGVHAGMPPHKKFKIRNIMVSILQGAGGLRESEPFHLWIGDVVEDPSSPGHALVKIHHPSESVYEDLDANGKLVRKKRGAYLAELGLTPRHKAHGNFHAGWKSPLLRKIKGTGEIYMPVFFFPTWWGEIFFTLYNIYMSHIRPHGLDHPFLFVSLDKKHYGQPWSIESYNGSMGWVSSINHEHRLVTVAFGNGNDCVEHSFSGAGLIDLKLAYGITCHKAQGSQAKRVVIPLTNTRLMDPTWLYTAITRAEEQCVLIGSTKTIQAVLGRDCAYQNRKVGFRCDFS